VFTHVTNRCIRHNAVLVRLVARIRMN
jgi:hypothetical protein